MEKGYQWKKKLEKNMQNMGQVLQYNKLSKEPSDRVKSHLLVVYNDLTWYNITIENNRK
jgi:hypothetical protein